MSDEHKSKTRKVAIIAAIVIVILLIAVWVFLSMLPTVGGSFGYGFPGGSGGRAIRDVEIDVDPQIVYRIDEHRFFTLEKYRDCNSGGFVYYNDTNKKIKKLAGVEGSDKKPQNEVDMSKENNVMAFKGRFVYSATSDIIAYPYRNVSYKYGDSTYFILYENIKKPSSESGSGEILMDSDVTVTNDYIYVKGDQSDLLAKKIDMPRKENDEHKWVKSSAIHIVERSQDDRFHCNEKIRPRSFKYIG